MPPIIGRSTEGRDVRIKRKCVVCRAPFSVADYQLARGRGKFCSLACKYEGARKQTEVFCTFCGLVFFRQTAELKRAKVVFCSHECRSAHRRRGAHSYPKIGQRHAHRVIAEQILGRKLRRKEIVHHKDRNKLNYNPSNLEVLKSRKEHGKIHAEEIGARIAESNRRRAKK